MILGAHESIAGGIDQAPARARRDRADALQLFTSSPSQWAPRPLREGEAAAFQEECRRRRIHQVLAHDSYLINLASPDSRLWRRSIAALTEELHRCARLGVALLVMHPGSPGDRGEGYGLDRVAAGLDRAFREAAGNQVTVLLENTAGQGHHLGHRLEHLAAIRRASDYASRLAVCFDTQHAFAAGYELRTADGYAATFERVDRVLGLPLLRAFHLNDSARELGSRVDRHARIGMGLLGDGTFRRLVTDPRFADRPGILETPPLAGGRPSFAAGLRRLRRLARQGASP